MNLEEGARTHSMRAAEKQEPLFNKVRKHLRKKGSRRLRERWGRIEAVAVHTGYLPKKGRPHPYNAAGRTNYVKI